MEVNDSQSCNWNCLVTDILNIVLFCKSFQRKASAECKNENVSFPQKKVMLKGLEWHEGEQMMTWFLFLIGPMIYVCVNKSLMPFAVLMKIYFTTWTRYINKNQNIFIRFFITVNSFPVCIQAVITIKVSYNKWINKYTVYTNISITRYQLYTVPAKLTYVFLWMDKCTCRSNFPSLLDINVCLSG